VVTLGNLEALGSGQGISRTCQQCWQQGQAQPLCPTDAAAPKRIALQLRIQQLQTTPSLKHFDGPLPGFTIQQQLQFHPQTRRKGWRRITGGITVMP
jgi:hypothetical protein